MPRSRSGHSQTGRIPTSASNQRRKSASRDAGISTSWTTRSRSRLAAAPIDAGGNVMTVLEADELVVARRSDASRRGQSRRTQGFCAPNAAEHQNQSVSQRHR